jgi:adenylyltransferase/sulfurtransferase
MMLLEPEKELYNRQLIIPDFGEECQEKLKNARVLIAGVGGLGSAVSLYLAAAGIGTIGIADADTVSLSNLQRQILFGFADVGKSKVEIASHKLVAQNPFICVETYEVNISSINAADIIGKFGIIVGALDNAPARYLVNDTCVALNKVYVHGAISNYSGQVSVFNYKGGKNYHDVFTQPPQTDTAPVNDKGVLAPLPGIVGSLMASEVVKVITGSGEVLSDKMLLLDLQHNSFQYINY